MREGLKTSGYRENKKEGTMITNDKQEMYKKSCN